MARIVRDAKMETRAARDRLAVGETIHWKTLVPGELHLGYRRRKKGTPGVWIARRWIGKSEDSGSGYKKATLGLADDYQDAGVGALDYTDAQRGAHAWHDAASVAAEPPAPPAPAAPTVSEAIEGYMRFLRAERKSGDDAERRARVLILPHLGDERIDALTTERLERWRDGLLAEPARLRTSKKLTDGRVAQQRFKPAPQTPDEIRARKATVNRTMTILKGALNRATKRSDITIDDRAWRLLEPFGKVDAARPGHLSVPEAQRLLNAADGPSGFRNMVTAGLLTGARYGELCRLRCADYGRGRVTVRESKSGKPRDIRLTEQGVEFFDALTAGRAADEPIFRRADGEPWGPSHQSRPMLEACLAAKIVPAVGFHQLRHTWASLSVMDGMPLILVAESLGHADTRMVEKHYGHLTDDYRDEMIRKHAPRFGTVAPTNVVPLDQRRRRAG